MTAHTGDLIGPLEREWRRVEEFMREKRVGESTIKVAQAMFLMGAQVATITALHSSIALVNMSSELRRLDSEMKEPDAA